MVFLVQACIGSCIAGHLMWTFNNDKPTLLKVVDVFCALVAAIAPVLLAIAK